MPELAPVMTFPINEEAKVSDTFDHSEAESFTWLYLWSKVKEPGTTIDPSL